MKGRLRTAGQAGGIIAAATLIRTEGWRLPGAWGLLAFWIDARSRAPGGSRRDTAFWLYMVGVLTFCEAPSARESDSKWARALYVALNLGSCSSVCCCSGASSRCSGRWALGVAGYLGYLSARVFADSLLFPLALTLIGLAVMGAGVWWQRHVAQWHAALVRRAPDWLQGWLPAG